MEAHVYVVVHDGEVVENGSKSGDVGQGISVRTNERGGRSRGRDVDVLSGRLLAQLLEECEEVISIRT